MHRRDLLLALMVTALWGLNFSVVKLGLLGFDPFLMAALRFLFCALPAVFFIPRPAVSYGYLVAYGLIFGVLVWGVSYLGIEAGLSAGLASLVLQCAAFFSILLGVVVYGEAWLKHQKLGMVIAAMGLLCIFFISDGSVSLLGLAMLLLAALAWAATNYLIKQAKAANPLAFLVWSCLIAPWPLLILSAGRIGWDGVVMQLQHLQWHGAAALAFQVYPATLLGYSIWNGLLKRYPLAMVAPLSLTVPVFGMVASMLIFGEQLSMLKLFAMVLILLGLAVNNWGASLHNWITAKTKALRSAAS